MVQIPTTNGLWGNDQAVLLELSQRLTQERLNRNLSQASLAEEAGISRSTVKRIEAGKSTQWVALIRILRVFGLLDNLDALLPKPGPSPLEILALGGKQRQRASRGAPLRDSSSSTKPSNTPTKPQARTPKSKKPWTWGDEK